MSYGIYSSNIKCKAHCISYFSIIYNNFKYVLALFFYVIFSCILPIADVIEICTYTIFFVNAVHLLISAEYPSSGTAQNLRNLLSDIQLCSVCYVRS